MTIAPTKKLSVGETSARRRWPFWGTVFAVFVSGLVIGSGLTIFAMHQQRMRMFKDPEALNRKLLEDVRSELNLNDEQVAQVAAVLQKRRQAFEELRAEIHPRMEREFDLLESQIAEAVPSDRRDQWRAYYKRFRREWMPPRPPAPPN